MSASKLLRPNTILILLLGAVAGLPAATGVEDLKVTLGKSIVIDYPTNIARISTSNPDVVDAVAVSTREILLHAKGHGVATIVVWAKDGDRNFYNISVEQNLEPIKHILKVTFPDEADRCGVGRGLGDPQRDSLLAGCRRPRRRCCRFAVRYGRQQPPPSRSRGEAGPAPRRLRRDGPSSPATSSPLTWSPPGC